MNGVDAYTRGTTTVVTLHGTPDAADIGELRALLRLASAAQSAVEHAIVDLTQASFRDEAALSNVLAVVGEHGDNVRVVCNRLMGRVMLARARSTSVPVFDSIRAASTGW